MRERAQNANFRRGMSCRDTHARGKPGVYYRHHWTWSDDDVAPPAAPTRRSESRRKPPRSIANEFGMSPAAERFVNITPRDDDNPDPYAAGYPIRIFRPMAGCRHL